MSNSGGQYSSSAMSQKAGQTPEPRGYFEHHYHTTSPQFTEAAFEKQFRLEQPFDQGPLMSAGRHIQLSKGWRHVQDAYRGLYTCPFALSLYERFL